MESNTNQSPNNQKLVDVLKTITEQLHAYSAYLVNAHQPNILILESYLTHPNQHQFNDLMINLSRKMIENNSKSRLFSDLDKTNSNIHPISSASLYEIPETNSKYYLGILYLEPKILDDVQETILQLCLDNISLQLKQSSTPSKFFYEDAPQLQLFQLIFNSVHEAISLHDAETEQFIAVNNQFLQHSKYKQEDILNKTVDELGFWQYEAEHKEYSKQLKETGLVTDFPAHFSNAKGEIYSGLISARTFEFNSENYFIIILSDTTLLNKTQKALELSEKKFRSIFNSLPDPVSINKLDESYAFTDINTAFIKNLGGNYNEYIGKNGFDLNLWADSKERQIYIETIKKHGCIDNYQAKYQHPDGRIIEGLLSAKTIEIDNIPHLLVLQKNIDQLLKLKESIKQSEEKFKMIFNASPDAINIVRWDDFTFVDVNHSFHTITQYKKEELLGKSIIDFGFWDNLEHAKSYFQELDTKGEINNFNTTICLKDNSTLDVLISATKISLNGVSHILNISRNIEDVSSMKKDIIESENKFRSVVENSHASIVIIDSNKVFNYVNPKSEDIFGCKAEELIGQKFEKWIHPSSIKIVRERYEKRQKGIQVPERYEFKIVHNDGIIKDIEISSSIHKDLNGNIFTIAQLLDITTRRKAIKSAFHEQQKLQQYLNIAPYILIALDIHGNVEMVNDRACEILGYNEEEILNKNWFETFLPKENIVKTRRDFKHILDGAQLVSASESDIITKENKVRRIHWQSTPIKDQEGKIKGLLSSGEDITERMNTLKILNQTKVIAILWKYQSLSQVHPIEYVSNNISKLIGFTPEELIEQNIQYPDLIHPDDLPRVLNEVDYYANNSAFKNYSHEYYRLKCKNGNYVWVEDQTEIIRDVQGEITHLNGLLIDVSEKKKSIELIKESEERYRTIFNSNLDGLIILNENGDIVEVNEVTCNMYGYSYQELMNRDSAKIKIASELNIYFIKDFLETNKILVAESEDMKKDGSNFHINAKLRYITYNHEKHILVIIRDISDIKKTEKQLTEAKHKAEESDQLKSAFLANMSHEIRTPMNAIIGFSSLLEEDDIDAQEKTGFISRIKNNGENLLNLINDIIDISKIEANQIRFINEPIIIKDFLLNLFESFEIEAQSKNIEIRFAYNDEQILSSFQSDTNRLNQVMANFLSNALKFTPDYGKIEFGCRIDNQNIIFYVTDTGIGIPEAEKEFVFDRFRQAHIMTHTDYGGTGLGLSISKGLIESLNGNIWMESVEGKGSSFFFSLPY